jgi:hypothetical protein
MLKSLTENVAGIENYHRGRVGAEASARNDYILSFVIISKHCSISMSVMVYKLVSRHIAAGTSPSLSSKKRL